MRALVTGGTSPLGSAIVAALARSGHHVIVHGHTQDGAARRLGEACLCDLTDPAATAAALAPILEAGPVQILVHAAGVHDDVPLAGMSEAQWRRVLSVTLDGFYAVTRPLLLPMIGTRWGRIIAISSVAAQTGNRGQVAYAAAKAGLEGAVRSLSREVASRGITVNAVAPGIIASPATEATFAPERIAEIVPAKRAGRAEEVADVVAFLASDAASYVSGQTIGVNGGLA